MMNKVQIMKMTLAMKEGVAEEEAEEEEEILMRLNQILFLHLINPHPRRKIKIVTEVHIQRLSHNKERRMKMMKGCLGMN